MSEGIQGELNSEPLQFSRCGSESGSENQESRISFKVYLAIPIRPRTAALR